MSDIYVYMSDISRKTYEGNGVKTIVHSGGILRLNEKDIKEGLDHKHLRANPVKYILDHKKR